LESIPADITDRLALIEGALKEETNKRNLLEKMLQQAEIKVRKSKKWIKAMAEEHTATTNKIHVELEQETNKRLKAEQEWQTIKKDYEIQRSQFEHLQEQGMADLTMMNEQLQRELRDIQQAEEAIRHNRARLRAQYKSIPIPTYSWQRAGDDFILVDYNDAVEQISKGKIFELMGTTASEAFKSQPEILEDLARCFNEKITIKREAPYELTRKNEGRFFISTYNFVPPNLVMVYVQDITAQKQTEQALLTSEEQIALNCRLSPDGKLTFVNDAYCWYFNQTREQVIGKFVPFVFEEDMEKVHAHFAALNDESNPVGAIEFRVIKPDGTLRWQQWITLPVFDQQNGLVEIQAVGRDITRRRQS
jgi:PAS domain S-box-containing protein